MKSLQFSEEARAKINLSLRILGRRRDGYHELRSLVVFADISDRLIFEPAGNFKLTISGPQASRIEGTNLIERAVDSLRSIAPGIIVGHFKLEKNLPVSAGIGGGSANAAAALRALKRANPDHAEKINWMECAASIGADVPVCYLGQSAIMEGVGERLNPVGKLPDFSLLLVNSGAMISTAEIFRRLGAGPFEEASLRHGYFDGGEIRELDDLVKHMRSVGNDLERPALEVCPEIAHVKAVIEANDGCLYSALSGSGATCFGLFGSHALAVDAERAMRGKQPDWWVKAARVV